mmetsp:Transcript_66802/g.196070  ORF Transcript_66802/g.196070 Transcript_66802/m.196070 type:complete len:234 (+) Transcript_66802:3111-3812(+)
MTLCRVCFPPPAFSGLCRMEPSIDADTSQVPSFETDSCVTNCSWLSNVSKASVAALFWLGCPSFFGTGNDFILPSAKPTMTESLEAEATAVAMDAASEPASFMALMGHTARSSVGTVGSWSRGGAWNIHTQGQDSADCPATRSLGGTSDSPLKSMLWKAMSSTLPGKLTVPHIFTRGSRKGTLRKATESLKRLAATYMLLPAWLMAASFPMPASLMRMVSKTWAFFQSEQSTM